MIGHNIDRYLDSSRVIRDLEEAERGHQLDDAGVLDELKKAFDHCGSAASLSEDVVKHQSELAMQYTLARAAYLAEIHRRVGVQRGKPTEARPGFAAWCRNNGVIGYTHAKQLVKLAKSADPEATWRARAEKANKRQKERYVRVRAENDPLVSMRSKWRRLSPVQRQAFIDWTLTQSINAPSTKYKRVNWKTMSGAGV